jgi:outer membrane protein TolC
MKKIVFMMMVVLPVSAFALNLEAARELALANSRSLAKVNMTVESAQIDEKIQVYNMLPSLSLGAQASANIWGEPAIQDSFSSGLNFSVNQQLYNGGKSTLLRSINAISTEITRQEALAEYFAVLDAVDAAYFGALEAGAALEAAESAREAAALALEIAEIRLEGGMISYGDYLQALAEKESKETAWNQSRRDLTLNKAKLRSLTAQAEAPEVEEVDFAVYEELMLKMAGLSDEGAAAFLGVFRETSAVNNPGMMKAALQNQQAEQSVTLARRDYLPSLSAGLSTGLNYSVPNGFEAVPTGKLSISASIPLDFALTAANVNKKEIARSEAALDLRNTGDSLDLEIQTAILDLLTQALSTLSSRRADEYAQRHYEQVLEKYRLSQSGVSELSDAAALATSNRNQYIKARYGFLTGLSKLRSLGCFSSDDELRALLLSL